MSDLARAIRVINHPRPIEVVRPPADWSRRALVILCSAAALAAIWTVAACWADLAR